MTLAHRTATLCLYDRARPPLRHDALQPHAADVIEYGRAVTRQVLSERGVPVICWAMVEPAVRGRTEADNTNA